MLKKHPRRRTKPSPTVGRDVMVGSKPLRESTAVHIPTELPGELRRHIDERSRRCIAAASLPKTEERCCNDGDSDVELLDASGGGYLAAVRRQQTKERQKLEGTFRDDFDRLRKSYLGAADRVHHEAVITALGVTPHHGCKAVAEKKDRTAASMHLSLNSFLEPAKRPGTLTRGEALEQGTPVQAALEFGLTDNNRMAVVRAEFKAALREMTARHDLEARSLQVAHTASLPSGKAALAQVSFPWPEMFSNKRKSM
ncbi:unnamed protein product [Chrysoparadoxa australica]